MWCMTATWLLVTVTGRTWNILRPLRMDSWPVVLHWPHTKGSPVGSLCTLPAWVPPWLGYIKLPASTISELLRESRLRLPRAQIGMHVHMNHKMRFDAITMNVMGRIAELKLLQKKKNWRAANFNADEGTAPNHWRSRTCFAFHYCVLLYSEWFSIFRITIPILSSFRCCNLSHQQIKNSSQSMNFNTSSGNVSMPQLQ